MLYAIVALLVIILDQWMKFWVAGNIALNTGVKEIIPGVLHIVNIHNDGAAFGMLSGKNAGMLFVILCAVVTIFVIVALATNLIKAPVGRWSALFIMAGGISNCIDRLLNGYVQDMFMLPFVPKFAIFNVADIFITVFCIVFILYILFGGKDDEEDEDDEEEYEDEDEELDAEDDDDDEDVTPHSRRRGNNDIHHERAEEAARYTAPVEEDDDDEDDRPRRRTVVAEKPKKERRPSRRDRQAELDEKYAEYKRQRELREKQWAETVKEQEAEQAAAPVQEPTQRVGADEPKEPEFNDPFAEWDKANRANPASSSIYATPAEHPAAPAPEVPSAPVQKAAPAAAPAPKAEDESFNLDDILAEFK